ncbi:MAG: hypothetical protein M1834_006196 [Cirrosporium novae-zelandiae]|nr:MAG: hypothetical protein M1834_006196 [Cirrosporium novae-zelandiae]
MFIPSTRIQPPPDMVMPSNEQLVFTVATQIPFIYLIYVAIRNIYICRDPTCLLFTLGGMIASLYEPIVDVLGMCFFPHSGNWTIFEFWNQPIPLFVPMTHSWYVGGVGYWFWIRFQAKDKNGRKKMRGKDIWNLWASSFFANMILKYPALYMGIYTYYGYQPLTIGPFPMWWPAVNATTPMVAASLINILSPYLKGMKYFVILPLVAISEGISNGGCAWPTWMALSADKGYGISSIGGCATVMLVCTEVWVMSLQFEEPPRKEVRFVDEEKKWDGGRE